MQFLQSQKMTEDAPLNSAGYRSFLHPNYTVPWLCNAFVVFVPTDCTSPSEAIIGKLGKRRDTWAVGGERKLILCSVIRLDQMYG